MLQEIDFQRLLWPSNCCYITEERFLWNLMISLWITRWYYVSTFDKHSWKRHIWRNDFKHLYFKATTTTNSSLWMSFECTSLLSIKQWKDSNASYLFSCRKDFATTIWITVCILSVLLLLLLIKVLIQFFLKTTVRKKNHYTAQILNRN